MSPKPESREEAIARLSESASALQARSVERPAVDMGAAKVTSEAYRIIAELLGGVLIGLAVGFGVDRLFGTAPWGLIGGVLAGFALSIYMARRTANRLMAQAKAEGVEPQSIPFGDDDEER